MSAQEQNTEYLIQRVAALEKLCAEQAQIIQDLTGINNEYFELWETQKAKYECLKQNTDGN